MDIFNEIKKFNEMLDQTDKESVDRYYKQSDKILKYINDLDVNERIALLHKDCHVYRWIKNPSEEETIVYISYFPIGIFYGVKKELINSRIIKNYLLNSQTHSDLDCCQKLKLKFELCREDINECLNKFRDTKFLYDRCNLIENLIQILKKPEKNIDLFFDYYFVIANNKTIFLRNIDKEYIDKFYKIFRFNKGVNYKIVNLIFKNYIKNDMDIHFLSFERSELIKSLSKNDIKKLYNKYYKNKKATKIIELLSSHKNMDYAFLVKMNMDLTNV